MPATELIEEVLDDALEEMPDAPAAARQAADEGHDVVFALSQRPPRPEEPAPAPVEIPRAAPVPSLRAPVPSVRTPFVPQPPVAPPSERAPGEAGRLLGEAEIFLKYGLRSKAMAHITRAAELEPDAPEVLSRVRDFYAALNDGNGVFRFTLRLAELLETNDPAAAYEEAARALEVDPDNALARALYERLHDAQVQGDVPVEDGALIDEGDVDVRDEAPTATPAAYFDPGFGQEVGYGESGEATEIG